MTGLAAVLAVSLAGLLLLWAAIFWAVGQRPRRPRPVLWRRKPESKPLAPRLEPVMSAAELEESFHRPAQARGKRG